VIIASSRSLIPGIASSPVESPRSRSTRLSLGFAVAIAGLIFSSQAASAQSGAATVTATPSSDVPSQATTSAQCRVATDSDPGDHDGGGDHDGQTGQDGQNLQSVAPNNVDRASGDQPTGLGGDGVFDGAQSGSLVKVTSAGANGSLVAPGETINVTITWNPKDFAGYPPARTVDCVKIGSKISNTLSQKHEPGPSGGTDHFSYVVPWNGTGGNQICDRATVTGPWLNTEKSAILCYTVMGVQTPEVPNTMMLPIAAIVIFGSGLWIARRRRRHRLRI
jgi:hypothetical protein